jgi:hypothetical protein
MRTNALENAGEGAGDVADMEDVPPPKQDKPKPAKAQTTPNKANGKKSAPAANGSASKATNTKGNAPQKRLRGSRQ